MTPQQWARVFAAGGVAVDEAEWNAGGPTPDEVARTWLYAMADEADKIAEEQP